MIMAGKTEETTIVRELKMNSNPSKMTSGIKIISQHPETVPPKNKIKPIQEETKKHENDSESVSGNESESPSDSGESMSIDLTSQQTEDKDTGEGMLDEKMARLDVNDLKEHIKRHIS